MLGFEVNHLAADHAVDGAGGVGDFPDDRNARLGWARDLRQHFIGLRLQGVSGKDGDGLAEGLVAGGTPAPQVVVIERRQIVVDQGISVEHFERRAQLLDACGNEPACELGCEPWHVRCRSDHAPRFHAEDRPQAFSAGKHAVPHGLMDGGWMLAGRRQELLECGVGGFSPLLQNLFHHGIAV